MIDSGTLILGLIFSSIGIGYFMYGKNTSNLVIRYTGVALMVYPYFPDNKLTVLIIGIVLMALPKFIAL